MNDPGHMFTTGLFFTCARRSTLATGGKTGIDEGTVVYPLLDAARRACPEHIIAIDALALPEIVNSTGPFALPGAVPPTAFRNVDPYREPVPVAAAGGLLIRPGEEGLDVLMIHRRGVWDLPKGKCDPGESIEACARREVCEEVGIDEVEIIWPLGQTVHGYVDGTSYAVKTTHWFLMYTRAVTFTPERKEGIETLEWASWSAAREKLGYEILRLHLQVVEEDVKRAGRHAY